MTALRNAIPRKGLHLAMGGFALLLRWLTPLEAAACAVGAVLFNRFALPRLTRGTLARGGADGRESDSGIQLYPVAVLGLVILFHRRLELAAAAWGLLAFGDGMATLAGLALGGPRLRWNPDKSWTGLLAFVLFGGTFAALLFRFVRADPAPDGSFWTVACFAAAVAAGVVESLRTGVDDNLSVPLAGAASLYAASLVEPSRIVLSGAGLWLAVNGLVAFVAWRARTVDRSGAIAGLVLGAAIGTFGGWRCYLLLVAFFLVGTAATRAGYSRKLALGIAESSGGRRGAGQAVANTLAGAGFAFLSAATPNRDAFLLAAAAAFATAAADTASSEIGQAWGRRHLLVTSFRPVPAGTDGAVSLEGTAAGFLAALALAILGWGVGILSPSGSAIVVFAALVGTTLESYVGAKWERSRAIDHDVLNFANTLCGALVAMTVRGLLNSP